MTRNNLKMTELEKEKYRAILKEKESELSGSPSRREKIVVETAPEPVEEVQLAGERELAIRNLDRDASMIRQIRSALTRIAEGSYGTCEQCQEDIAPKRLIALPWATFCISCQEQTDREKDKRIGKAA